MEGHLELRRIPVDWYGNVVTALTGTCSGAWREDRATSIARLTNAAPSRRITTSSRTSAPGILSLQSKHVTLAVNNLSASSSCFARPIRLWQQNVSLAVLKS
jgi:hypothetical protein